MDALTIIQALITGVLLGGIYGVITVGFDVLFGVLQLVNFAQGELIMFAMYLTFFLGTMAGFNIFALLIIVPVVFLALAPILYFGVFKIMIGRTREWGILYTVALSLVLQNTAMVLFLSDPRQLKNPFVGVSVNILSILLNEALLIAFGFAMALFVITYLFIFKTERGTLIRATVDNRPLVSLLGINHDKVYLQAFCFAILLTAVGSVLLTFYYPVYPTVGSAYIMFMLVAMVLGGSGSIRGSLVGGIIIGVSQVVSAVILPVNFQNVVVFCLFIAAVVLKPRGLFGRS